MMTEDLQPCETLVQLHFKYDYNIPRADMFSDHVGEVRLFVIDDATNNVVKETVVSNRDNGDAIKNHPDDQFFKVVMNDLTPGQSYRFAAIALQRPYDETLSHQEDKFVGTLPASGNLVTDLQMKLTRSNVPDSQDRYEVVAPGCGLDTLWMGHTTKAIKIPQNTGMYTINDTISMVRDTKYLSLTLRQLDNPTEISDEDFRIEITDANGWLGWDNELIADQTLLYTPHQQWTTEVLSSEGDVTERAAHFDISFSRLMYYTGAMASKNASLRIFRVSDNEKVVDINLASILSQGRNAFEIYNYSPQEYLDREYDYDLDFFLKGGDWQYISVKVNVMAWAIRIQHEKL